MTTRILREAPPEDPSAGRLWYSILAGPIAWFAQLALVWAVVEFGCRLGMQQYTIAGFDAMTALVVVVSVLAGLATVAGILIALDSRRRLGDEPEEDPGGIWKRQRFMAASGLYLSVLFSAVVILTLIPVFVLPTCIGPGGA